MNLGRSVLWASCVIVAIAGCSGRPKQESAPVASAPAIEQVAWDAIAGGAAVIDVRTDAEFRQGHLPGAVNIPYDQIVERRAELPPDLNRPVVLYCRSGRRSGIAKQSLEELGFTNAINGGGYDALMRARPR
jgi:phage shock protein E